MPEADYGDWNHSIKAIMGERWACACGKWSVPWKMKGVTDAYARHLLATMRREDVLAIRRKTSDDDPAIRVVGLPDANWEQWVLFFIQQWESGNWVDLDAYTTWPALTQAWYEYGGQKLGGCPAFDPKVKK